MLNNTEHKDRFIKIEKAAHNAAKAAITGRTRPIREIRRLHKQLAVIRNTYKKLVYSREAVTPAFEWLYDNYYILEREGRQAIKELWKCCPLPSSNGKNLVRLHAEELCASAAGAIDAEAIEFYIKAAQEVHGFESSELSAMGIMLKVALIDGAARACSDDMAEDEKLSLMSDAVKTLNFLNTFDFSQIVERQSILEKLLSRDPAGIYSKMDERTRALYRSRISKLARKRGICETEAAEIILEKAQNGKTLRERHVGYYILDMELDKPRKGIRGRLYLMLVAVLPAVFSVLFGMIFKLWWLPFLIFLPLWEIIRPLLDYFMLKGVPATFLPRMELEGVIPGEAPTLVAVSTLLTSPQKAEEFAKKLEQFYYSNGRGSIMFGLLADLKESNLPEKPEDKAICNAAVKYVRILNRKYGNHFFLCIRSRRFNKTQGNFSGWERKRGAITEFVRLIKGLSTSISICEGDINFIKKAKYIITLDADTELIMDSAAEMVSAAIHPLNVPEIHNGIVVRGHGILAPRIGVNLESASITPFSRIMAGAGGVTAYDNAAGDTYQDIFGEGIFAGKGIINIDAFHEVLESALPENRILSHDIIEGCFLRAGFLSDVELTDGFPAYPISWFERLHRWIRGDWQNIWLIIGKLPDGRKNPLNALSRFKLLDNLRRSLTPVLAFVCLSVAAFMPAMTAALLILSAVLSLSGAGLFSAFLAVLRGGPSMLSRKYHCRVFPQAINSIAQGALAYLFLPHHVLVALDAVVRALWRLRTGKKLLEWVTAAETESQKTIRKNAITIALKHFWMSFVVGVLFLFLAPQSAAKFAGAFFIITPFVAWMSGKQTLPVCDELSDDDVERLRSYAAATWRFYEDFVTEKDNFLPPDNFQEAPVSVVAHRTSPTNIGLFLLSTLAARDLNLIDDETMLEHITATISTMEKLEKWKGHLYNWYDTITLKPLKPIYVSTVDSGNLLCCLVALREGIKDYCDSSELIRRITKLIDDTDLGVLYNRHRKFFHLGYDVESGKLTEIYYDLLMSEARMTSYYAIAKKIVPKRHWGTLGRTLTRHNGYTGPISWTGTMFEYLMPHLLLPVYEDSMAAETMRFVVYCQQRRVRASGVPWGISESGFYSFDAALNYQYAAHGVQKLALKRGMDDQLVISPYSTFLALPFCRSAGMKNLKKLESLGMYGRCGFYEAADFSYKRTGGRMAIVKSYMAHHVGMSLVAADNALFDGIMQDRFMRDHEMQSAKDLLCEKIPSDAVVFKDVTLREMPEKPGRYGVVREDFDIVSPVTPRVNAVSNGEYTMVLTDCGASISMFHGVDITRRSSDILRLPTGIFAFASFKGEPLSVTAAPEYNGGQTVKRHVEFNTHGAIYHVHTQEYGVNMQALLHSGMPCEIRAVELENYTQKRCEVKLLFYFEPSLARPADESAHPAFSRLFLQADYRHDTKMIIFSRRTRGVEIPACIAVGFAEHDIDFEFDTDRSAILKRPYGAVSLPLTMEKPFSNKTGAIPEATAAIRIKTEISPRAKKHITFIIAAASNPEEAAGRLVEARRQGLHGFLHNAAGKDSGIMETRLAALVLPQILFQAVDGQTLPEELSRGIANVGDAVHKNKLGQSGLWQIGVSGDFPITLFHYSSKSQLERLESYVKMHRDLRLKGIQFDLVITYQEGGEYARSKYNDVMGKIRTCGCDYLCGSKAGIHIVNLSNYPDEIRILLISTACHIASDSLKRLPSSNYNMVHLLPTTPLPVTGKIKVKTFGGCFTEDAFIMSHEKENPLVPWSHIIATPTFGTLVTDKALGFTWAINARENKLTPWSNDTVLDLRGEMIIAKIGQRYHDLCLNAKVTYNPHSAIYESEAEGIRFTVQIFIPGAFMAKVISLEVENVRDCEMSISVAYYTEPILSVSPAESRHISIKKSKDGVFMQNPWSQISGCSFLTAIDGFDNFVRRRDAFLSGKWDDDSEIYSPDPCAAVVKRLRLPPKRSEKINFVLGFAGDEKSAKATISLLKNLNLQSTEDIPDESVVTVKTPDERLNILVNSWLRTQFMNSRIRGRTGFYQCGGAWGFRDQLQDICAAIYVDSKAAKAHIYRCAAHQFKEGDVMHWWHQLPPRDGGSRGVRTRCSDDLLWLPYAVCEYLEKTGDYSIFDHEIYYLDGPKLDSAEDDRYFSPTRAEEKENVYGHCIRAINRAMTKGRHGIPLFGSGDWNDGMNLVGNGGEGESVWLAMFLVLVLERFAKVARHMSDDENAVKYEEEAKRLKEETDKNCWDGNWYLRGFYDDGSPLGSHENLECRIDILPQSFAAIADFPNKSRRREALDSMLKNLADERLNLVRLFDPAFDKGGRNPGYIRSYSQGIRENGGQYTHAAVWGALGLLCEARADEAYKILSWINPIMRSKDADSAHVYRLEPYAIAADIYTNPSCEGRGGWSLYTGAAGWYYRTVIEYLLGIKIFADKITLAPCIPDSWDGFEAHIKYHHSDIQIKVMRMKGGKGITVDGKKADYIPLDGKAHEVTLLM